MADEPQNRDGTGRFLVGNRANPGGRPKRVDELAKPIGEWTPEFLERAKQIVMQGKDQDSVAMLKVLWAYRYGSPAQVVTDEDGNPARIGILVLPAEDAGG